MGGVRIREDNRLSDAPMEALTCHSCQAQVEVRKSSWAQTSVQWHAEALAACVERRASSPRPGPNGRVFTGCMNLRDSVREAAVLGDIHVLDDELVEDVVADPVETAR